MWTSIERERKERRNRGGRVAGGGAQGTAERGKCGEFYLSVGHMQATFLVKCFHMYPPALAMHFLCQQKDFQGDSLKGRKHTHTYFNMAASSRKEATLHGLGTTLSFLTATTFQPCPGGLYRPLKTAPKEPVPRRASSSSFQRNLSFSS